MRFTDVFEGIRLDAKLQHAFSDCEVDRVTAPKNGTDILVMLSAENAIDPACIPLLETELQKQFFLIPGESAAFRLLTRDIRMSRLRSAGTS